MSRMPRVPLAVLLLVAAAAATELAPALRISSPHAVEWILTVALVAILFEGGMHIGLSRLRPALGAVLSAGLLGTILTVAAGALLLRAFGLSWFAALLVATAVAPTDPAVVFSVLGKQKIAGHSSTILEGESGANDPVGIALMVSLLSAGAVTAHAAGEVAGEFALQMAVGVAVGAVGGRVLVELTRRRLPVIVAPLCTMAAAAAAFALATLAHGSGFLAVFIAGILFGDESLGHRGTVRRIHRGLASLGEIVAFVVLGLTVHLGVLAHRSVWLPGIVLAVVVAGAARPILVGLCLIPARLARNELAFVLFAGLKGAVPLLLGQMIVGKHVADAPRLYGIVVIVVIFSILVQGTLTPTAATRLKLGRRGPLS